MQETLEQQIAELTVRVDQVAIALVELRNLCAKLFVITEAHRNVLEALAKMVGGELVTNANSGQPVLRKPN